MVENEEVESDVLLGATIPAESNGMCSEHSEARECMANSGSESASPTNGDRVGVVHADWGSCIVNAGLAAILRTLQCVNIEADVPIDAIDPFSIRVGGLDPREVQTCAESMMDGIEFDSAILLQDNDGRLRPGDGGLRILATRLTGKSSIRADIYAGDMNACIDVGLTANRHGRKLKTEDYVHAISLILKEGKELNISEFSRKAGISRPTTRKYLRQARMGYSGLARKTKMPKTEEEKAKDLAGKVARMVDEGESEVIRFIFESLSPYTRGKMAGKLREEFPDVFPGA